MPKAYKLLVFDWDGTVMDSAGVIVSSLQQACLDLGLEAPSGERARHVIGLGLRDALSHIAPSLPESEYEALSLRYRTHFLAQDLSIPLFPGALGAVQDLHARGFSLAVATGKSRHGLDRVLAQTGLGGYFHYTRCADEGYSKPHPGMLQDIMQRLSYEPHETLMIGDTSHDLQMAINAGVDAVAVAYGAHTKEDLLAYRPLLCAATFKELHQCLIAHA